MRISVPAAGYRSYTIVRRVVHHQTTIVTSRRNNRPLRQYVRAPTYASAIAAPVPFTTTLSLTPTRSPSSDTPFIDIGRSAALTLTYYLSRPITCYLADRDRAL